jgi:hypothetical protein
MAARSRRRLCAGSGAKALFMLDTVTRLETCAFRRATGSRRCLGIEPANMQSASTTNGGFVSYGETVKRTTSDSLTITEDRTP